MPQENIKMYTDGNYHNNPFIKNPNNNELVFKTNIVFGSLPIGNPADISINAIEHIMDADILLVESHREFARLSVRDDSEQQLKRANSLHCRTEVDLQPGATIYQYQLESNPSKASEINKIIIDAARNGKNIFVVSDEGSSVFLEPANLLKQELVGLKIPYTSLPGPFSGISAVTTSDFFVRQFFFGESLPSIPKEKRQEVYSRVSKLAVPTVFLLTAVDARWCVSELAEHLGDKWVADFQMSLTMKNEKHVYGTFQEILNYIDERSDLFMWDDQEKKFAILLYPDESLQISY